MPINIGIPELIIVFFIVLLVFGAGRIAQIGGDLGRGIREFREGVALNPSPENTEKAKASNN